MKRIKIITAILGISMFLFGVLKFIKPFKEWYCVQIEKSGFSQIHYEAGIAGEILTGLTLIMTLLFWRHISIKLKFFYIFGASAFVGLMMLFASLVHLNPNVPSAVLPLKIKPPIIPLAFFVMAIVNIFSVIKLKNKT